VIVSFQVLLITVVASLLLVPSKKRNYRYDFGCSASSRADADANADAGAGTVRSTIAPIVTAPRIVIRFAQCPANSTAGITKSLFGTPHNSLPNTFSRNSVIGEAIFLLLS